MADVARPTRRQIVSELGDVLHDLPAILTTPLYRRWHLRWGATPAEAAAALPGDALLPRAQYKSTRAITIGAPPDAVWPWLVQVGCQRAGFYSNDLLDNLGHPSATTIVPSLQKLEVGQWVPMSPAATPTERTAFKVHSFELAEWLLWSKPDSTWAWRLTATGDGGTRLVTRIHAVYDWRNPLMGLLGVLLMEFGDFAMLRRMLRGIKARAESLVQDTAGRKNKMSRTEPGVALTPAQRILAPNAASGEGASGGFYTPTTQRPQTRNNLQLLVGLAAIAFSAVYFISDLIEVAKAASQPSGSS
jgi:hypothetical protein